MKKIFLGTSGLLMAQILFAGSAQVGVDCKSDSGMTTVTATVPGDETEYNVSITIKDKKGEVHSVSYIKEYQYKNPSDEAPSVPELLLDGDVKVVDGFVFKDKAYALVMSKVVENGPDVSNTLYAIPETVEFKKIGGHERNVKFRARLSGYNPRLADEKSDYPYIDGQITLNCTYSYSI